MRNHEKMHITEVMATAGHSPENSSDVETSPAGFGDRRFFIEEGKLVRSTKVQSTWPGNIVFVTTTLERNEERLIAQLDYADETR